MIPVLSKKFWNQNNSETEKGRPRCFSTIWDQKNLTEKRDNPFLSKNFFHTRTFPEAKNVPPRCFLKLWDQKFSTENRESPPLCINFLGTLNFLNHKRVLHKFFGTVRQKQSTESCYLIIQKFFDTRRFPKHKAPPTKFFGTVRQKRSTESWYPYYPKHFDTRIFLKYRRVGFAYEYFWRCETKNFDKVVIPL